MAWYYYNCISGPGHQSESDGFRDMSDTLTEKEVAEEILEDFTDREWPIIKVWKVDQPPVKYIENNIKSLTSSIKSLQERLKYLKTLGTGSGTFSEPGEDLELKEALKRTVSSSLMQQLHKRGVIVTAKTVSTWRGYYSSPPTEKPLNKYRIKVMNAIKACDKYPKY